MSDKKINRLVALGVFLISALVYLRTLSTTVVFWDVGEFCASSWLLQVPHPPGSPLFIILARVVSMVPFFEDIAKRMHAISSIGSALGISFLYLVGVKLIMRFRGTAGTTFDKIITYGSSAIGALALAFSTTYWDNAIEAEVYGLSMLFVSLIIWLSLRWWERSEEPHNEKYMLLIAYLIGLSVGVHLLSILATFSVLMLIYFRRYEVTRESFIRFTLVALGIFFIIYPGIVQLIPSMLDGEFKGVKSEILPFIPLALIVLAGYGVYRTLQTKQRILHLASLAFLLIVLGYTTYLLVLMRSNVDNLPMNENNPNTLARLTSYLTREQYGDTPILKGESWNNDQQNYVEKLFPRRWSREAMHEPTRANYTSDGDFFWRYQINHMYIRYVLWNFVGAEGDWQDAGVGWKDTWGIPFFVGLFGIYYHFKKDWKMALTFFALFTIMGIVLDLYQNQQEPQPRERDYFYVGAYFCIALWIGIGLAGIIDYLRTIVKQPGTYKLVVGGVLALAAFAIPFNLARTNWHEHDRSKTYIAWDYSYNMLQTCEPDAILFTNGDNDTFPLWYLQDVEGVRRDVRIVNLSLVNTAWYIHQLKNQEPHGAKKVPISFTNDQIERITPVAWKPRQMDIPVSKDVLNRYLAADRPLEQNATIADSTVVKEGKISFTMNGIPYQQDVRVLRVQDIMVRDIVMANHWERPIYFAVTCSPDSKIGLDNYMWMQGLAYKLKPFKTTADGGLDYGFMAANLLARDVTPAKTFQHGYMWRNLNRPDVYYDENVQRMVTNYRYNFMRLAEYNMRTKNDNQKAREVLARMEDLIPISIIPMQEWRLTMYFMQVFNQIGDTAHFNLYAKNVEENAMEAINNNKLDPQNPFMPYQAMLEIYDARKDYAAAIDLLNRATAQFPNVAEIKSMLEKYEQKMKTAPADSTKPRVDTVASR